MFRSFEHKKTQSLYYEFCTIHWTTLELETQMHPPLPQIWGSHIDMVYVGVCLLR